MQHYYEDLHNKERPTALFSSIFVNANRDPKKNQKPSVWSDFCFYKPTNDGDSATLENGSAMLHLVKERMLPYWALFCFREVTANANESYRPARLAFVCDDAILIHPVKTETGYSGLLIAQESASASTRQMVDPETGEIASLRIPQLHAKMVAQENIRLMLS